MHNITLLNCINLNTLNFENNETTVCCCFEGDNKTVFVVTSRHNLFGINTKSGEIQFKFPLETVITSSKAKILCIEYIPDLNAVCIAATTGEIVLFELKTNQVFKFDYFYSVLSRLNVLALLIQEYCACHGVLISRSWCLPQATILY